MAAPGAAPVQLQQAERRAEDPSGPTKRALKRERKRAAENEKARRAKAAEEAATRRERRQLWDAVPELFAASEDVTSCDDFVHGSAPHTASFLRSHLQREIPPAARKA